MDSSMNSAIRASIPLLTACLSDVCSPASLDSLHVVLMSTLSAHLAPTWQPERPTLGASLRALRMSPNTIAPRPIRMAAEATGIRSNDWILLLTQGQECEVSIDPGLVSYRIGKDAAPQIYWQGTSAPSAAKKSPWATPKAIDVRSTFAFSPKSPHTPQGMTEPSWMSSLLSMFPDTPRPNSPIRRPTPPASVWSTSSAASDFSLSPPSFSIDLTSDHSPAASRYVAPPRLASLHSRTNSETSSSEASSLYSALSHSMSQLSVSTAPSSISPSSRAPSPTSAYVVEHGECFYEDDEESHHAAVFIDPSRKAVTEYECGKVGVLGGAVMLGMPQRGAPVQAKAPMTRFQQQRPF